MSKKFKITHIQVMIEEMISNKHVIPGDRLPSLRKLHKSTGVSLNCIVRALKNLTKEGLVESRPGSGYYVTAQKIPQSDRSFPDIITMPWMKDIHERADTLHLADSKLALETPFDMQYGFVPSRYQPLKLVAKAMRKAAVELPAHRDKHLVTPQLDVIKSIICAQYRPRGLHNPFEHLIPNVTRHQAIRMTVEATARGNSPVAIISPASFLYFNVLQQSKRKIIECHQNHSGNPDITELERIFLESKPALLIACPTTSNPTGATWTTEAAKDVLDLCRVHNVHILEIDDSSCLYKDGRHPPLAAMDPENVTLYSNLDMQATEALNFGWLISKSLHLQLLQLQHYGYGYGTVINNHIARHLMSSPKLDDHISDLRTSISESRHHVQEQLKDHLGDIVHLPPVDSGFFLWVQIPQLDSTSPLLKETAAQGILFNAGDFFSPEGRYKNWLRLNCLVTDHPFFDQAMAGFCKIIKDAVESEC